MKKKIFVPIAIIVVLIILAVGYYFIPKTFGKNVNPSEVDHINVFDGNTGIGFTITNPKDIKYIVENIQSHSMKKDGVSLGKMGYSFKISYIDSNNKDVIPVFILNSDDTIRKDPFFYVCDGGLCFDYIKECEETYKTNVTGAIKIEYGTSDIYTEKDMNDAIDKIIEAFEFMGIGELHSLSYSSDEICTDKENIAWMNELEISNDNKQVFVQCIMFDSSFRSPKEDSGSLEPDEEYTWTWWLARSEGGEWKLMTWGY